MENPIDITEYDMFWRNKPELPVANEENKKLENLLKLKKIEVEKFKSKLENNINKGKNMRDHIRDLCQTLNYKQQLFKTKQHELEMETHAEKLTERECSRLEQEVKAINHEINSLKTRQKQREGAISEQKEKREKLKSSIQWDEERLFQHLEKSASLERDNMALMKYTSEDDSKLNELGILVEKLSKEAYEKRTTLEEANTEVLIVESELDTMQDEFRNAYNERNNLINNWEKVINQIEKRNKEVTKLSEHIEKLQQESSSLKHTLKEQKELLSRESERNDEIERVIKEKDNTAAQLRLDRQKAFEREEGLKAQLSTIRNVLNNLLYQKQAGENNLRQLEKQLDNKTEKILQLNESNKKIESDIENLTRETFDADHYSRELDNVLQREKLKNQNLENEIASISKDILTYTHIINDLKTKEKFIENQIKNKQTEIRKLVSSLIQLDQIRTKQESELYSVESNAEKLRQRVKKMAGETDEEERRQIELQRSSLLAVLEEKKKSLSLLTEEIKTMEDKMNTSSKELDVRRKRNAELMEKIKFLEFYISNSQKSFKCCISRKQEMLVQECLEKFQMKRLQKLLNNKNRSLASLQKNKLEFETMMKERSLELKHCNELIDAEIRTEDEECSNVKRKFQEFNDRSLKLQTKYKVILDALGVSDPGEGIEAEILINAENEKRDLQQKRDGLISSVLKNDEELSALRNTLWVINAANEQFRQALHPSGINSEDSEMLRITEAELESLSIEIHTKTSEQKSLEENIKSMKEKLEQEQNFCKDLQIKFQDKELENEAICKELSNLQTKLQRADRCNSRLSLEIRNKSAQIGIEEDIRIHLLREIRRIVSDLLFSAVESMPEIATKIQELYAEANLPLPSRARSSLSRSSSVLSFSSRRSSRDSPVSSARSSRASIFTPSVVTPGLSDTGS